MCCKYLCPLCKLPFPYIPSFLKSYFLGTSVEWFFLIHWLIGFLWLLWPIVTNGMTQNDSNLFPHSSGGQQSEIKVSVGLVPCGGFQGESTPFLSPSFWYLPAIVDIPWPGAVLLQSWNPSSYHLLLCSVFSVCLLEGHLLHLDPLPHPQPITQDDFLISESLIIYAETLFANQVAFTGSGIRTRTYLSGLPCSPLHWENPMR